MSSIKLSRDTKTMMLQILTRFIELENKKAVLKSCIFDKYQKAPMTEKVKQSAIMLHVRETLRHPDSNQLARMVRDCLNENGIRFMMSMGYRYFAGIKER